MAFGQHRLNRVSHLPYACAYFSHGTVITWKPREVEATWTECTEEAETSKWGYSGDRWGSDHRV